MASTSSSSVCRFVLLSCLSSALLLGVPAAAESTKPVARVLIYSATAPGEFRHDSIPTAIQALNAKGPSLNVQFDNTEDKTRFNDEGLAVYDALLFLDNTGEVLDDAGKTAFQNYLNLGGNFIGVHAASDCLRNTTFYGNEVGARFDSHPALQNATVNVLDSSHPSTSMLPAQWHIQEEMYNFKSDPRSVGAVVLLSPDASSYTDTTGDHPAQGSPHPSAWYQEKGAGSSGTAGRSFYTSLGHLNETWQDDLFLGHITGGISWALLANTTKAFNTSALVGNGQNSTSSSSSASGSSASATSSSSSPSSSQSSASIASSSVTAASTLLLFMVAMATTLIYA